MATTKQGQPITASRAQMQASRPVMTDQRYPSSDAEKMISRPPVNPYGEGSAAQLPAPPNENFRRAQTAGAGSSKIFGSRFGGMNVTELHCGDTSNTDEMNSAIGESASSAKGSFVGDWLLRGGNPPKSAGQINLPGGKRRRR